MLTTPLCRRLGIMHPVLCAGMGGLITGPALAAAVSSAGGLGVLGLLGVPAPLIADAIRAVRSLTDRPFGVNVVLAGMTPEEIAICLAERVPVIVSFWGDPSPYVAAAHERGTVVLAQVGSVAEAIAAVEIGVDGVIAQGVEAGGHVRGTTALSVLLPAVCAAVHPIPVIAAGGVADGRGVAAALALGAQAVSMGTRFLASNEAAATDAYKARIVVAVAEDTVLTSLFDLGWPDAPHRALRNRTVARWEAAGRPPSGSRPGEGDVIGRAPFGGAVVDLPRYSVVPPIAGYEGDVEDAVLYAGESCTLVHDVRPAAEIVRAVVEEAAMILGR